MDIRHLRYFQAVAEELSFSEAAHRLNVAQPALSRTVKELEEDVGVLLLSRSRRSVSLTPAGAVLLHEIGLLLQRLDETVAVCGGRPLAKKANCDSDTLGRRRKCSWVEF